MHLKILDTFGISIGIKNQLLTVAIKGQKDNQYPLKYLRSVSIANRAASISSDAISALANRGIPLFFLDYKGSPVAQVHSPFGHGTVTVRRSQYAAYSNHNGRMLVAAVIRGKLLNQKSLIKYIHKSRSRTKETLDQAILDSHLVTIDKCISQLEAIPTNTQLDMPTFRTKIFTIEAMAAQAYWSIWSHIWTKGLFVRRELRGTNNPINIALNYAYGILRTHIYQCVINAGLDPYAGILHTDRAGKPSFILDCMEEFRPWLADRAVIKLYTNRSEITFDKNDKTKLINIILAYKNSKTQYRGRRVTQSSVIQSQIWRMCGTLLNATPYKPWVARW